MLKTMYWVSLAVVLMGCVAFYCTEPFRRGLLIGLPMTATAVIVSYLSGVDRIPLRTAWTVNMLIGVILLGSTIWR